MNNLKRVSILFALCTIVCVRSACGMDLDAEDGTPFAYLCESQQVEPWTNVDLFETEFSVIAEHIKEAYYLKPYPGREILEGKIPRPFHGGAHVIHVALILDYLMDFYKKYSYDEVDPMAAEILNSDNNRRIVKIVGLLHDSGRKRGGKDYWEKKSSDNCLKFLINNGIPEEDATFFSRAIMKKKGELEEDRIERNFVQHLLCTADSMEIMRTTGFNGNRDREGYGYFNLHHLIPFTHFAENNDALSEFTKFAIEYRKMLKKQCDLFYPSPLTQNEQLRLEAIIQKYNIVPIPGSDYIHNENFFGHVLAGRSNVNEDDKKSWEEMDRSFSFAKKIEYELCPDTYQKLERDFRGLLENMGEM